MLRMKILLLLFVLQVYPTPIGHKQYVPETIDSLQLSLYNNVQVNGHVTSVNTESDDITTFRLADIHNHSVNCVLLKYVTPPVVGAQIVVMGIKRSYPADPKGDGFLGQRIEIRVEGMVGIEDP